jgi:hypothetical protein
MINSIVKYDELQLELIKLMVVIICRRENGIELIYEALNAVEIVGVEKGILEPNGSTISPHFGTSLQ